MPNFTDEETEILRQALEILNKPQAEPEPEAPSSQVVTFPGIGQPLPYDASVREPGMDTPNNRFEYDPDHVDPHAAVGFTHSDKKYSPDELWWANLRENQAKTAGKSPQEVRAMYQRYLRSR